MSDLRKAAEAVLEAWGWDWSEPRNEALRERIEALRQALAQPEQEPVAHLWECIGRWTAMVAHDGEDANLALPDWLVDAVKAATAPPKREWVGLTYDEVYEFVCTTDSYIDFAKAIEAKLKEKNT